MPLFEVAILSHPTKKEAEDTGAIEKLVFGPKAVVAKDPQAAAINSVLDGSFPTDVDKSRIQVLVRPFV